MLMIDARVETLWPRVPLQPQPVQRGDARAKAIAVLAASPRLMDVRYRTVKQMRLVNARDFAVRSLLKNA